MIALHILDVKDFMAKLLIQTVFDNFLLTEMEINTFTKFQIQGRINKSYFSSDEIELLQDRSLVKWNEVRGIAFQIMKGNKTPSSFHIVLQLSPENVEKLTSSTGVPLKAVDITGLYMHLKYENNQLTMITGTGVKIFTMDKTLDKEWDDMAKKFLKHHGIVFEE